jgi:ABC-type dipeptide/oligopeptide/nickel transport system permease subunit
MGAAVVPQPRRRPGPAGSASGTGSPTAYPPVVILIVTIIAFSLIGDALRDSLDVRLRRR